MQKSVTDRKQADRVTEGHSRLEKGPLEFRPIQQYFVTNHFLIKKRVCVGYRLQLVQFDWCKFFYKTYIPQSVKYDHHTVIIKINNYSPGKKATKINSSWWIHYFVSIFFVKKCTRIWHRFLRCNDLNERIKFHNKVLL